MDGAGESGSGQNMIRPGRIPVRTAFDWTVLHVPRGTCGFGVDVPSSRLIPEELHALASLCQQICLGMHLDQ